jgi:hypothetical protein
MAVKYISAGSIEGYRRQERNGTEMQQRVHTVRTGETSGKKESTFALCRRYRTPDAVA